MRAIWNILFIMVLALLLGYGGDAALAQTTFEPYRVEDVIDGDWRDWGRGGPAHLDRYQDVTPDSNNSIDIIK